MAAVVRRILVTGIVQGVGFRPFVWRRATRLGLAGWVANRPGGVVIELRGPAAAVDAFCAGFAAAAPPLASVRDVRIAPRRSAASRGTDGAGFTIRASRRGPAPAAPPPADVAPCAACRAEVADAASRRHGYAFTNCSDCGPRYTIITGLPYDRAGTTMRAFAMCAGCAAEYGDPADRRFHAQPIACPACGPRLWFAARDEAAGMVTRPQGRPDDAAAIAAAQRLLRAGGIVAVKGLGGFHLCCDATNPAAVDELRARKHRPGKPFAVLVADVGSARRIGAIDAIEAEALAARDRPIVLLRRPERPARPLAGGVAPGTDLVGVMLPCMPLQELLCAGMPPLVMTSGNVAAEPIVTENAAAIVRLGAIADGFLLHDREIGTACDDTVTRCVAGRPRPLRLGRGRAPLPIDLGCDGPSVLAVGGDLKAAPCVTRGAAAFMGQHVGDADSLETLAALGRAAEHLLGLLRIEPEAVVADLHPGSRTAAWAARFAADRGIPLVRTQHHEAHLAALRVDRGVTADVIGVCCDGTGYGHDGTIQGGEFLVATGDAMRRAAHLAPFPLPGGDAAVRHPWRAALGLLHAARLPWDERLAPVRAAGATACRVLARILTTGAGCVPTTSMGRLFDGVAALAGLRQSVSYEAEAALALEAAAGRDGGGGGYAFRIRAGDPLQVEWAGVVTAIVADALAGVPAAVIAGRFHRGVAEMIAAVCGRLRAGGAGPLVGLTGGVFQNALLTRLVVAALRPAGCDVLLHDRVPCNDGGLALGQAVLGRRRLGGRPG